MDGSAGCNPAVPGGIVGGVSLYILKPYFQNNTAYTATRGVGTTASSVTNQAFDWGYQAAPAFWLGYELENGVGVRGRYFSLDGSSKGLTTGLTAAGAATGSVAPSPGLQRLSGAAFASPGIFLTAGLGADQLNFGSDLHIETYDVEATYETRYANNLSVVYSAGGRYLHSFQTYRGGLSNTTAADPATGLTGTESQNLNYNHNFQGGGPTVALQATWRVGNAGLAVYGSARGSLLVGTTNESQQLTQTVLDPAGVVGGNQLNTPRSGGSADNVVPVFEAEAGVEFGTQVGRFQPFFRAAVVNQNYFDLGNASSKTGTLALFGAQLSLGTNY
jgi:hypothetical protein